MTLDLKVPCEDCRYCECGTRVCTFHWAVPCAHPDHMCAQCCTKGDPYDPDNI